MRESKYIIDRIADETEKKAAALIAKARDQAELLIKEARDQTRGYWQGAEEKARREAAEEQKRAISGATLESKKMLLDARRRLISKVFDGAADKIRELGEKEYESFIKKLIIKLAEGERADIFVAYKDQDRLSTSFLDDLNKAIAKSGKNTVISYSKKDHDIYEGFVISSGKYQIDVSLKSIIDKHKEVLEADVVRILFQ